MTEEADRDKLKELNCARGVIKGKLTRNAKFFAERCIDHNQIGELKGRLSKLEECWGEFEEVQSKIELLDLTQNHDAEREEFEAQYYELYGKITTFIEKHTATTTTSLHNSSSSPSNTNTNNTEASIQVRLPTINLPHFSGKYEEWLPFFDSFSALIHENNTLNEVQKLHYLRAALQGEAANTISNLELTASNYNVAIGLLKEQYQNTRLIVQQHVRSLFELTIVSRDKP